MLVVPAAYGSVKLVDAYVEAIISGEPKERVQVVLAVHELCVNIIRYAYGGQPGTIAVDGAQRGRDLALVVRDHAPTAYAPPSTVAPPSPSDLPEGGWGMYILNRVMDQVVYQRVESGNQWSLQKRLSE